MNTELQQLKDIHLPQAINMWSLAPGWIILLLSLLGLISYLLYFWYQQHKKKYTVKFALAKLNRLKELSALNPGDINIAAEISTLIRRTALYYFRREDIAGLSGKDWLLFLNRSGNTSQFTEETGRLLIDAPYRKNDHSDLTSLFSVTHAWLLAIAKKNKLFAEK